MFYINVKRGLSQKGRTQADVFEITELCTIYGPKREAVTGGCRIMVSFMACLSHKIFGYSNHATSDVWDTWLPTARMELHTECFCET